VSPSPSTEAAAQYLVAARRARRPGDRLPESNRPHDCESALAIQHRVSELLGESIGGWKAAIPAQDKISVGPICASDIYRASPCPVRPSKGSARIEPEIAFVLGQDLGPRGTPYTEAEIRAAISETRLTLEVLGGRYADPENVPFPEKLADAMNNQALFVGPVVPHALDQKLDAFPLTIDGPAGLHLTRAGVHPSGHPLAPLYWLANFLSGRGEGLKAGQIVTAGSYCGVLELPLGAPLRIAFDGLGILSVVLANASTLADASNKAQAYVKEAK
jgi:2-keto-4-pentenoate hydratase